MRSETEYKLLLLALDSVSSHHTGMEFEEICLCAMCVLADHKTDNILTAIAMAINDIDSANK